MTTETDILTLLATLLGGSSTAWNVWFWYDKKKNDKEMGDVRSNIADLKKQQIEHANKFITEQRSREIIREEIKPVKDDTTETKQDVKDMMHILTNLQSELRVVTAVQKLIHDLESKK